MANYRFHLGEGQSKMAKRKVRGFFSVRKESYLKKIKELSGEKHNFDLAYGGLADQKKQTEKQSGKKNNHKKHKKQKQYNNPCLPCESRCQKKCQGQKCKRNNNCQQLCKKKGWKIEGGCDKLCNKKRCSNLNTCDACCGQFATEEFLNSYLPSSATD